MKKFFFLFAQLLLVSFVCQAASVSRQHAAQQARDFMSKKFSSSHARRAAQTVTLNSVETGQELVYAFNVEGGGFVVVAGDDCAPAILGYSETSAIDPDDMPEGMKALFEQYQQEMQSMILNGQRAAVIADLGEEIKPLMQSKWGQGAPYNYMCPKYVRKGKRVMARSLTGCPATAMSQIMYYHKYPAEIAEIPGTYYNRRKTGKTVEQPDFTKTLEWDKMLPTYGTRRDVGGTQEQQDAVAKLLRLAGQSVCMAYSPEVSGSYSEAVYTSLVNFFKYDVNTMRLVYRDEYSYADWIKMIYEEMKAKRPVYYTGFSNTGGHAYVIDGYKSEDYFYINWGWYGSSDDAFRLSLCNPSQKYEGGGTGAQGYSGTQNAIIGIQPAATPGHVDPLFEMHVQWMTKDTYTRASASENFDLTGGITQWICNSTHFSDSFGYGVVVKDIDGKIVQQLLPLNDGTKAVTLKPGGKTLMNKEQLGVGAGLGNGTYTLEARYRIGEGEWKPFSSTARTVFKIDGNTLTFDARPDWLTVEMVVTKLENTEDPCYAVAVKLENKSTDKTFNRTLKLGRDNLTRYYDKMGFAIALEPGETKTFSMLYTPEDYTPKKLYLVAKEDGAPICYATIEGGGTLGTPDFGGDFNITAALKQQTDKSYVLKADYDYEVIYNIKNNGTGDFTGYIELVDSVMDKAFDTYFEKENSHGELITLKPGETCQLRLTIENDYDSDIVHKLGLVTYSDNGDPFPIDETKEFSIRPVCDLRFTDFDVTPKEKVDDEYADYIVKGSKATVSGKIQNTEDTAFEGTIIIKRYTTDFSQTAEQDDDGDYNIDCDKIFMTDVTIPAGSTYNYSQEFDLQGLVTSTSHSVIMDFELSFMRNLSGDEVPLYYSPSYLLNDATTGIREVEIVRPESDDYYNLKGQRVNKSQKGLVIHKGRKYLNK